MQLPGGANATFLADIIIRFILRSHRSKKLAYVYLANDLIQKSTINKKKVAKAEIVEHSNDFRDALAPPKIDKALE